jgi:hypothetical protein
MVTVEFTEAEAKAAAGAVWAYIDDDYYPRIDIKALRAANGKLITAVGGQRSTTEVCVATATGIAVDRRIVLRIDRGHGIDVLCLPVATASKLAADLRDLIASGQDAEQAVDRTVTAPGTRKAA